MTCAAETKRTNQGGIKVMGINDVSPERLAELLHHYHEALAPEACSTSDRPHTDWKEVPPREKNRLVAVARLALLELKSVADAMPAPKPYFARPGEAEWGC
jgi:hypothetical protein